MLPARTSFIIATILFFSIGLLWQANAWGKQTEIKHYLTAGIDLFRWQEFDANQTRLLSEQGPRLSLQAGWDDVLSADRFGQINLRARLYSGDINYDGQTQSLLDPTKDGIFISSTSRYDGFGAELENLHPLNNHHNVALFLGLGVDLWRRDIQDSIDAQGNPAGGFKEDYQVLYSRLGLQRQDHGIYGSSQIRFGIKYPLRIDEQVIGITLHPGQDWSLFASYRLNLANHSSTIVEIYYDSLRLATSPIITDQYGASWLQPQSHQDSIGIMIGRPF